MVCLEMWQHADKKFASEHKTTIDIGSGRGYYSSENNTAQRRATHALGKEGGVMVSDMGRKSTTEKNESLKSKFVEMLHRVQTAIRAGDVDREQTVDLFNLAIGPRSKRQFADDLGVNVSSVSRISNGQVNEISPQLLAKIAFYADPNSGVTLDQLMEAQGLVDSRGREKQSLQYEQECRRIMADELLSREYSVFYGSKNDLGLTEEYKIGDFSLRTNALGAENALWIIECKTMTQYSMLPIGSGRSRIWIDRAMAYYYCGGKAARISLVVDHSAVFEQMKKRMSVYTIPNEISVILISTKQGKVLDEYVAPLTGGVKAKQIFNTEAAEVQ